MYTLSPSKSIKGNNYGEFLKDKKNESKFGNMLFVENEQEHESARYGKLYT
jgi:hypothetical protein